jgi:hypothetical protein
VIPEGDADPIMEPSEQGRQIAEAGKHWESGFDRCSQNPINLGGDVFGGNLDVCADPFAAASSISATYSHNRRKVSKTRTPSTSSCIELKALQANGRLFCRLHGLAAL